MRGKKCQQRVLFFIKYNRSIIAIPRRVFRDIFTLFFFLQMNKNSFVRKQLLMGSLNEKKNMFSITAGHNSKPISPINIF